MMHLPGAPVFITLQPPFRALRTSTIANIMEEAIRTAGLENKGYSAKSFRPTGETAAIDSGQNPDIVMKTGRWKTASVFRDHYVDLQPPIDHSHNVFYLFIYLYIYYNLMAVSKVKVIRTICKRVTATPYKTKSPYLR